MTSLQVPEPGIAVCGADAGFRLTESFAWTLDRPIPIYCRHAPELLLDTLKAWQHPLCILEHRVSVIDMNVPYDETTAATDTLLPERTVFAHELLPLLIHLSPETRYIITSHTRGTGVGPDRAIYKRFPQVVRVLGFLNSGTATKYLYKYVEQRWGARIKSQEQLSKDFEARQQRNSRMIDEYRRRREQRDESNDAS